MKISFQRTGGFVGIPINLNLDLDSLPESDAAVLQKMIADADFFELTEAHLGKQAPDGFQYVITVEGDGQQRTIQVTDINMPNKLRPLINDLSLRARSQRRA
jgi:hypothetical protein